MDKIVGYIVNYIVLSILLNSIETFTVLKNKLCQIVGAFRHYNGFLLKLEQFCVDIF